MIVEAKIDTTVFPFNFIKDVFGFSDEREQLASNIDMNGLNQEIGKLTEQEQYIIKYRYVDHLSFAACAEKLELSEGEIRKQLAQTMQYLYLHRAPFILTVPKVKIRELALKHAEIHTLTRTTRKLTKENDKLKALLHLVSNTLNTMYEASRSHTDILKDINELHLTAEKPIR